MSLLNYTIAIGTYYEHCLQHLVRGWQSAIHPKYWRLVDHSDNSIIATITNTHSCYVNTSLSAMHHNAGSLTWCVANKAKNMPFRPRYKIQEALFNVG